MTSIESDSAPNDGAILQARDVTVRFGGLNALSDVSLDVQRGRITGLIGPNGSGKSTLLGVLSGILKPQTGSVVLDGREVTSLPPEQRARLGLARSFQHPELFPPLSVSEHLLLGLRMGVERGRLMSDLFGLSGWRPPSNAERERVDGLIELLGLQSMADRECIALPSGVARLVDVGRALALQPSVLMLDEPAAGLDDQESAELFACLKRASTVEGVSLLLVEHDLEFVVSLCDVINVLDAGTLIATGSPAEIQEDPAVQAAYLGAPALSGEATG